MQPLPRSFTLWALLSLSLKHGLMATNVDHIVERISHDFGLDRINQNMPSDHSKRLDLYTNLLVEINPNHDLPKEQLLKYLITNYEAAYQQYEKATRGKVPAKTREKAPHDNKQRPIPPIYEWRSFGEIVFQNLREHDKKSGRHYGYLLARFLDENFRRSEPSRACVVSTDQRFFNALQAKRNYHDLLTKKLDTIEELNFAPFTKKLMFFIDHNFSNRSNFYPCGAKSVAHTIQTFMQQAYKVVALQKKRKALGSLYKERQVMLVLGWIRSIAGELNSAMLDIAKTILNFYKMHAWHDVVLWDACQDGVNKLSCLIVNKVWFDFAQHVFKSPQGKIMLYKDAPSFQDTCHIAETLNQSHIYFKKSEDTILGPTQNYHTEVGRFPSVQDRYNRGLERKGLPASLKSDLLLDKGAPLALAGIYVKVKFVQTFNPLNKFPFYNTKGKEVGSTEGFSAGSGDKLKILPNNVWNPNAYKSVAIWDYQPTKKYMVELILQKEQARYYRLFLWTQRYTFLEVKKVLRKNSPEKMTSEDFFVAPNLDLHMEIESELVEENKKLLLLYRRMDLTMNHEGVKAEAFAAMCYSKNAHQVLPKELLFDQPYYLFIFSAAALLKGLVVPLIGVEVNNPGKS